MIVPDAMSSGAPGRLIHIDRPDGGSYHAYVPAPLPPRLMWTDPLIAALSDADRAIGRLAAYGRHLPNPHLLIGASRRREAVSSSRIEGTQASLSDLVLHEADAPDPRHPDDAQEVANYVAALDHGLSRLESRPVGQLLFREMHDILLRGVRGHDRTPGEFRQRQVWIAAPGTPIQHARYIPPPPDHLGTTIDALEQYMHAASELPPLVRIAMVHYQFEAIHPFLDGNGRIGRLIITLMLCADDHLPGPLLYLSEFFERHRLAYYDALLAVSLRGDWETWLLLFLRGVEAQSLSGIALADALLDLREQYRGRVSSSRASRSLLPLVEELFVNPWLTAARVSDLLDQTPTAAQANIEKLVKAQIITEVTGRKRDRVYVAQELVRLSSGG